MRFPSLALQNGLARFRPKLRRRDPCLTAESGHLPHAGRGIVQSRQREGYYMRAIVSFAAAAMVTMSPLAAQGTSPVVLGPGEVLAQVAGTG